MGWPGTRSPHQRPDPMASQSPPTSSVRLVSGLDGDDPASPPSAPGPSEPRGGMDRIDQLVGPGSVSNVPTGPRLPTDPPGSEPESMDDVTIILDALAQGDLNAAGRLLPLVYDDLRRLAGRRLASEAAGQTLQPTALVHEAYLRLVKDAEDRPWSGRGHFFAAAAEAMRRILVEQARRKKASKRGGGLARRELDPGDVAALEEPEHLLALDEALDRLAAVDPRMAELVKLRFFAGLSVKEVAATLGVSPRTVDANWSYARAWLYEELRERP